MEQKTNSLNLYISNKSGFLQSSFFCLSPLYNKNLLQSQYDVYNVMDFQAHGGLFEPNINVIYNKYVF